MTKKAKFNVTNSGLSYNKVDRELFTVSTATSSVKSIIVTKVGHTVVSCFLVSQNKDQKGSRKHAVFVAVVLVLYGFLFMLSWVWF